MNLGHPGERGEQRPEEHCFIIRVRNDQPNPRQPSGPVTTPTWECVFRLQKRRNVPARIPELKLSNQYRSYHRYHHRPNSLNLELALQYRRQSRDEQNRCAGCGSWRHRFEAPDFGSPVPGSPVGRVPSFKLRKLNFIFEYYMYCWRRASGVVEPELREKVYILLGH